MKNAIELQKLLQKRIKAEVSVMPYNEDYLHVYIKSTIFVFDRIYRLLNPVDCMLDEILSDYNEVVQDTFFY